MASNKYANSEAVGFRCVLAAFQVMNSVSSHKQCSHSASLPTTDFQEQLLGLSEVHIEKLSASFKTENSQSSIHQINVFEFSFQARKQNTLRWEHFYAYSRQTFFFKAGPGEQIMSNEVQVNMTRAGSW